MRIAETIEIGDWIRIRYPERSGLPCFMEHRVVKVTKIYHDLKKIIFSLQDISGNYLELGDHTIPWWIYLCDAELIKRGK